MTAVQTQASRRFLTAMGPMVEETDLSIDPDFKQRPLYTTEEYFDRLAKKLGQHFGMDDIREVAQS